MEESSFIHLFVYTILIYGVVMAFQNVKKVIIISKKYRIQAIFGTAK